MLAEKGTPEEVAWRMWQRLADPALWPNEPRPASEWPSPGLLLDLLATGDREAVDAAMERYIAAIGGG